MKLSSALTILAASGAASASIMERQVQAIIGVISGINTELGKLDTIVKGFSGDPKPLAEASKMALETVTKGVETVNGASTITLTDSVQIQGQVQNLQASLEGLVSDLLAKKSELVAAGQGQVVYKSLTDQMTGAKSLSAAISTKVPPDVKTLADQLSQGLLAALQKGIDGFKDAGSGGSGGSPAPSGSTPPSSGESMSGMSGMSGMPGMSHDEKSHDEKSHDEKSHDDKSHDDKGSTTPSSSGGSGYGSTGTGSGTGTKPSTGGSGSGAAGAKPPVPTSTNSPSKPAVYTGAAPRTVAGSFAVVVAAVVAFAL
ncbi:hypothetical protein FKW77_002662 [Venturia effusa]|uniref:Cell wall protein n=1 Tax=Venturia effusa TaxID=50376 RepID=A0A517KZ81_9PEZI|nr:hypothetical protein FKW77_002662 [Venturia effusa]